MVKGKGGINSSPLLPMLPLPSLLSFLLRRCPCLLLQLLCHNRCCHNAVSASTAAAFCSILPAPPVSVVVCHRHSHCCQRCHRWPCFGCCCCHHLPLPTPPPMPMFLPLSPSTPPRCLSFHQCQPLLLQLPTPLFLHVPQPPRLPFYHSCWHFLVDCCLTHLCHCSTDDITIVATDATAAIHCPPKPLMTLHCCCFNHCCCAAGAAFIFSYRCLSFALAGCCGAYSRAASLPLNVVASLDAPLPPICPVGHCVASCHATTSWCATAFQRAVWLSCRLS